MYVIYTADINTTVAVLLFKDIIQSYNAFDSFISSTMLRRR